VRWANLERIGTQWDLKPKEIQGIPNLNTERQQFSQMQRLNDALIVAIRDDAQGTFGSGWFAIDSGVILESHDDHYHAHFSLTPTLLESHIDEKQGNPAHVYRANGEVLLANDSKNGFTSIAFTDPSNPRKLTSNFFTSPMRRMLWGSIPLLDLSITWNCGCLKPRRRELSARR
jgi:hypothetical protein